MKKTSPHKASNSAPDELRPEYRFDYSKAKSNRFASMSRVIVLDEDVAEFFSTPEAVNQALRSLMEKVPQGP